MKGWKKMFGGIWLNTKKELMLTTGYSRKRKVWETVLSNSRGQIISKKTFKTKAQFNQYVKHTLYGQREN